jgi:hypothetical protein
VTQDRKRSAWPVRFTGWVGIVIGVAGAIFTIVLFPRSDERLAEQTRELNQALEQFHREKADLQSRWIDLAQKLDTLNAALEKNQEEVGRLAAEVEARGLSGGTTEITRGLVATRKSLEAVLQRQRQFELQVGNGGQRLLKLESIILDNPEKALALPLLRAEIARVERQAIRDFDAVRLENARAYDLMKWVVGMTGAVSFGLIGLAVGNLFKRESRPEGSRSSSEETDREEAQDAEHPSPKDETHKVKKDQETR